MKKVKKPMIHKASGGMMMSDEEMKKMMKIKKMVRVKKIK